MRNQRFVIIFEGRTGSSFVVSCLNSHPDILCYPEILAKRTQSQQQNILRAFVDGRSVARHNPHALQKKYFHKTNTKQQPALISGFKVKLYDISQLASFHDLIHKHHIKLIYLKRQNVVKAVVSEYNRKQLKEKYGIHNAERPGQVQGTIYIPPDTFLEQLDKRSLDEAAHEKFFEECRVPKQLFYYENLLDDPDSFFRELLAFLEVRQQPLEGNFLKNTPDDLSDAIENYDEVLAICKNTVFEKYFKEKL